MKSLLRASILIVALLLTSLCAGATQRVACIGNSITYGYGLDNPATESYPAQLARMLGSDYEVGNFGFSGATLMRHGHRPYFNLQEFRDALAFKPDIALIHLGINDTDPRNWPQLGREFATDYMALIDSLRAVNPDVRIIIANLSPITPKHYRFRSGTWEWRMKIRQVISDVARAANVELIDFETPLLDHQHLLPDALHPTTLGATRLAKYAYSAITGRWGGLHLPEVLQSGMVLQRHTPLTIAGTADRGSQIALTLDGITYHATTDNCGTWRIVTAPLATGGPYTLTVTDGATTIALTNILAGELWIAAGQSNMAFTLAESLGAKEAIARANDPWLRIYDKKPIAYTDNHQWPAEVVEAVDSLSYYLPANWQSITPANAPQLSAVAYYFAQELRQAMPDVPIGIVSLAVGGSTLESWIDISTLHQYASESLNDWHHNDWHQKWVQGRAMLNSGEKHRHPYEPGYLFSAAIRPLASLPIAGVIWYQGESNDHNTELFERNFRLFAQSWRNYFGNPRLPILEVQLSSIDRPAWPHFRDAQRRLSLDIPDIAMAVSHDYGDSLDVHPINKRPIGRRLARQALHRLYGFSHITPQGPTPTSVVAKDGAIEITLDYADGLTTSDGLPPRTFEIATYDGLYRPADVAIADNKITLTHKDMLQPQFVRYAWQPFTRANVVNADSLPMSTFQAQVDNAADLIVEPGLEYGISAPYAATAPQGTLIVAGGCNFPTTDPLAPGATKKFYKGIYAATTDRMEWRRIGSLPAPAAYGATAQITPTTALLIGGTTDQGSTAEVYLMEIIDNTARLTPMPSLPAPIDNMAAAAIGRKVYVAGGNYDGTPSRALLMLDLDNPARGWQRLRDIPGNPRVQPVMSAANDADGQTCLYLFGGFAPRHDGKNPTLETDGLRYSPSKNKWSTIAGPTDSFGNTVSLGGGCAATLPDGTIAMAGGVNKDVFLDALTDQKPDYLLHPISWYRFNPNVFIFNPARLEWSILTTTPDAARAGAVLIAPDSHLYLFGGELKPRIRTAETLQLL